MSSVTIIITDGVRALKFCSVKQSSGGIYCILHLKEGKGLHFSYHLDGVVHLKDTKNRVTMPKRIPLKEIKKIYSIGTFSFGDSAFQDRHFSPYDNEKLSNIVWIDTRCFSKYYSPNLHLYLVRPEYLSDLSGEWFKKKEEDDYHLIQIINAINPWLVVFVNGIKNINK